MTKAKLPMQDAKKCLQLFDQLDLFILEQFEDKIIEKNKAYTDINEIRIQARTYLINQPEVIDLFLSKTPSLTEEEKNILLRWKNYKTGRFIVIKCYKEYAIFFAYDNYKFYGVKALHDSFSTVLPYKPPLIIQTRLFPYNDCIIWDGLVGVVPIAIGKNMAKIFKNDCNDAHKNGEIITQL